MYHKMKIAVARSPILAGKKIRLHRKIMTFLFGPEETLTILIPGRSVQDIKIKEISDEQDS